MGVAVMAEGEETAAVVDVDSTHTHLSIWFCFDERSAKNAKTQLRASHERVLENNSLILIPHLLYVACFQHISINVIH